MTTWGVVFSAVAATSRERNQRVSSISIRPVALFGFLGGASLPLLVTLAQVGVQYLRIEVLAGGAMLSGAIGSAIAASIVHIAKRAPRLPSEQVTPELPSG